MSSNVNGCFADALVVEVGVGVCATADIAIAKKKVRIFQCIGLPPLSAQTLAEPLRAQPRLLVFLLVLMLVLVIDLPIFCRSG